MSEEEGEKTLTRNKSELSPSSVPVQLHPVTLYTSMDDPFAHRVHAALLERNVDIVVNEIHTKDENGHLLDAAKSDLIFDLAPFAQVPVIQHNSVTLYDSTAINEYLEESEDFAGKRKLLPIDPSQKGHARAIIEYFNHQVVPLFYYILLKQTTEEQDKAKQRLLEKLKFLNTVLKNRPPNSSYYFVGKMYSLVEVTLLPFFERLFVLEHYRNFKIPCTSDYHHLLRWFAHCRMQSSFRKCTPPTKKILEYFAAYADGTINTVLANDYR